jgi:hypothetical protein
VSASAQEVYVCGCRNNREIRSDDFVAARS